MASLSYNKEAKIILAFNLTTRYLEDLLNIDNSYFESIVGRIYQRELQLNKVSRQIPKPQFWIYIYLFLTDLFHPKFMKSAMTLI